MSQQILNYVLFECLKECDDKQDNYKCVKECYTENVILENTFFSIPNRYGGSTPLTRKIHVTKDEIDEYRLKFKKLK